MRFVVTGGGTGGHVYPALEVALASRSAGHEVAYWGSERGMEGRASADAGFAFRGFDAWPLVSLRTPAGWRAFAKLARASVVASRAMGKDRPDRVFSTGGYGAAPVLWAARRRGVPYVLHEANSVPGRVTRMFAPRAMAVNAVFRATSAHLPGCLRLGQPVRRALREIVPRRDRPKLLVMGGSGGAKFLNEAIPTLKLDGWEIVHATGRGRLGDVPAGYPATEFLGPAEVAEAYATATVFVGRSGGTLAELAAVRLPGVLIPLPTSADDHQLVNAREFAEMGAARLVEQSRATPAALAEAILSWTPEAREAAEKSLGEWDRPDATMDLVRLLKR